MTVPHGGSPAPWAQPPRRGRHSSGGIADRTRSAMFRSYHTLSGLGRGLGGIMHGTVAAVLIGLCIAGMLALVTIGVAKVGGPIAAVPSSGAGETLPIGTFSHHPVVVTLPARPESYVGAYRRGVPGSYAPIEELARATAARLNVALYYSGWREKFRSAFAVQAAANGAVPFIQIEPLRVSLAAIVAGVYDTYLETFATGVASYGARTGHAVIIGFGHEMNGYWYPWGYRHTSPKVFVAAWRHIVTVFRQQGADNVTWLWTVNIIDQRGGIRSPAAWWPGSSYVTWVGIDGYYLRRNWQFAPLFGPTIKAVRALDLFIPILIAETGAAPSSGQPAKIANLFAGIRAYGLLGFVWFDAPGTQDWRLTGPAAFTEFGRGARTYQAPAS
jgi:mannan endo-1,4-beta-mannosidase